jgi:hypothetical protein
VSLVDELSLHAVINNKVSSIKVLENMVDLYISTGETQCHDDGLTIDETSAYLTAANIEISASQCGVITGIFYAAVCGGNTANIYIHTISADNLVTAENLGFSEITSLLAAELGYEVTECSPGN